MKSGWIVGAFVGFLVLAAVTPCAAQEPARDFLQLETRLKAGDTVWVTDAQGREIKGKLGAITSETVTLEGGAARVFRASDVRTVRRRDPARGTWTGAAIGGIAGLGAGIAACAAYPKDDPLRNDACAMAVGLLWMPGLGAGALVGAMFPGRKQEVYRAPESGTAGTAAARLSVAPVVSPRKKGVAIAISF